ncbi:hypothetical protein SASPL_123173 [Salvia splendens]|uniref:Uncharacterized protein n=1 Tax=Salvia splendens TaxID=180675 RepID=A0A8X8XPR1_SALSN|nr:hypothetical protein SASPL_123173 [Salvia splendens]
MGESSRSDPIGTRLKWLKIPKLEKGLVAGRRQIGLDAAGLLLDNNARYMRFKSWPLFDEWKEIFGKDRATGSSSRDLQELYHGVRSHLNVGSRKPFSQGRNYYRALHIVGTVAKVRSSLMLLDVDTDGLVVEMFQLFLNNIGSNNPSDVFKYMEMIMTMVIEESDDISFNLLRPLLASVKMKNRDISPISWELGKKVLENCETKLQSYLREAAKVMNLEFDDYAEIVAYICHETSNDNNKVCSCRRKSHLLLLVWKSKQIEFQSLHEIFSLQTDDGNVTKLGSENLLEAVKESHQIVLSEADKGAFQKRRKKKPSSAVRTEEDKHTMKIGDWYSHEGSRGNNEEKNDLALTSEQVNSSMFSNSSRKKIDSFSEDSLAKYGQSKKKRSMINQHKEDLEFSLTLKRKILKMKERGHNAPKKTGKTVIAGSGKVRVEKISVQKKSRRPRVDFGEHLVNLWIQVWWPMDEILIVSVGLLFDSFEDAFSFFLAQVYVLYDDDEIEFLNLRKENWKLCGDEKSLQIRSENLALGISEYTSSPGFHQVVTEFDEVTCETNVSAKDSGVNRVSKEEFCHTSKKLKEMVSILLMHGCWFLILMHTVLKDCREFNC